MSETIKQILIRRDEMSEDEAAELISAAKEELEVALDHGSLDEAEDIIMDYFGLEPDYLDELLFDLI